MALAGICQVPWVWPPTPSEMTDFTRGMRSLGRCPAGAIFSSAARSVPSTAACSSRAIVCARPVGEAEARCWITLPA